MEDMERPLLRLHRLNRELESLRAQGGAQRRPPYAQHRHVIHCRVGGTALEALQQCGAGHFLPSGHEAGREETENREEVEEEHEVAK